MRQAGHSSTGVPTRVSVCVCLSMCVCMRAHTESQVIPLTLHIFTYLVECE